ncbi:MAG: carbohydrate ABC transporter permease [Clostridia bacterium]|nr:carbohydrate ABC transporter permease [Clostridia bacterium]
MVCHLILIILSVCCLYPFLIILGSSFEAQKQLVITGYRAIPVKFSLEAYSSIFSYPERIFDAYKITAISTVLTTAGGIYLESTLGYVISRKDYSYRSGLSMFVFFTMLFNGGLVPSYILISRWLELKDTIWALVLPGLAGAWHVLMFKTFFMAIPPALIESAKIDGAKEYTIFFRIIIPLSKPAFACIGLFLLLQAWNDWYSSLLYIETESKVQLQYLLMSIMQNIEKLNNADPAQLGINAGMQNIPSLNARMAMCVIAAGPILVIFPFFQKYFVKGLTVGSVKG